MKSPTDNRLNVMKRIVLIIFPLILWASGASAQVAVIVHKSVPADSIKKYELLDLYTGDIRVWDDDRPVVVFDLKPRGDIRKTFYKYLGKSSSRMKSIWMKNMLSGEGDPPESVKSEEEILEKVASTPGAIGFVNHVLVNSDVKTLLVIEIDIDS